MRVAHVQKMQLSGGERDHHFVERRQALTALSEADQRSAAEVLRPGQHVDVGEALADARPGCEGSWSPR